jgi:hypothetical protein
MKNESLLKKAGKLGYPLFEKEDEGDTALTLAEVVKSRDLRLWEGFPVMFATALEKGLSDPQRVRRFLKSAEDKDAFCALVAVACGLYAFSGVDVPGLKNVEAWRYYSLKDFQEALCVFKKGGVLKVGGKELDAERLRKAFERYFSEWESVADVVTKKESFGFEFSLNRLFSPKQKELFLKRLKGEKMTKTEREYYSRVVRKTVLALANPELYRLARQVAATG